MIFGGIWGNDKLFSFHSDLQVNLCLAPTQFVPITTSWWYGSETYPIWLVNIFHPLNTNFLYMHKVVGLIRANRCTKRHFRPELLLGLSSGILNFYGWNSTKVQINDWNNPLRVRLASNLHEVAQGLVQSKYEYPQGCSHHPQISHHLCSSQSHQWSGK